MSNFTKKQQMEAIAKGNLNDFVRITKANGGCTFNLETSEINPMRGYAVALKGMEETIPVSRFKDDAVVDFINKNVDFLSRSRFFIGSWVNDNKVYLDVVELHENIEDAVRDGMKNDQLAIFDCKKQVKIKLPKRQKSGTLTQNKSYNDAAARKVIQEIKKL